MNTVSLVPFFSKQKMLLLSITLSITILLLYASQASAISIPTVTLGVDNAETPEQVSTTLQIFFLLTIISVAPAIVLMMTSFTRIIIVLGFLRQAMGTQNMPPTQVILGLSLFLTFFIMSPTINKINDTALQPYLSEEIQQDVAFEKSVLVMREFMFSQVRESELQFLADLTLKNEPTDAADIPTTTLIPAFMLSELKRAFSMGFMVYIPFLVIDMIVAAILMSMGMMMLPPVIISMPFKLLLFILVDGWTLIVGSLIQSFG